MLTLAHVSDLHLAIEPRGSQLLGKRGLGLINWRRKRKTIHRRDVLDALTRDLKAHHAGHIAVTGDLVNFSLPAEYALAGDWLRSLGDPRDVTALPGNHDVYVRGAEPMPAQYWADYMRGDDGLDRFPFVRRRGDVALIALSSAVATGPFMATGTLGARQLARFAEALDQTQDVFRVVLIHHPPWSPPQRYLRRLTDAAALCRVLVEKGAELLLHGHDHRSSLVWLDGPGGGKIPAAGVPSASAEGAHGEESAAAYHLFTIEGTAKAGKSRCEMIVRQRTADGTIGEVDRQELF